MMKENKESGGVGARTRSTGGGEPCWLMAARESARLRALKVDGPFRKDPLWSFTDPDKVPRPSSADAYWDTEATSRVSQRSAHGYRLVFVDGCFKPLESVLPEDDSLELCLLSSVGDEPWVASLYGVLEEKSQDVWPRSLAAWNTAYARDGVIIRVKSACASPVWITHRTTNPEAGALHHCLLLEDGASVSFIEEDVCSGHSMSMWEIRIGRGARCEHIRLQSGVALGRVASHMFAAIEDGGVLDSFTWSGSSALVRNEVWVDLEGSGCSASISGSAFVAVGGHHDDTVHIGHQGCGSTSRQVFQKVVEDEASAVFQGKIRVASSGQRTDGYQSGRCLILCHEGRFFAKPELEIHADDVRCSHGTTAGALDEDAVFFLRSRGIPLSSARALLVLGFMSESADRIAMPSLARLVRRRMSGFLSSRLVEV